MSLLASVSSVGSVGRGSSDWPSEIEDWFTHKIHPRRPEEREWWYDIQWRFKARYLRDGQCGVVRAGKIFSNSSVPFLPWAYARGNVILCMCLLSLAKRDIINKIKARFQALIALNHLDRVDRSREKRHGDQPMARRSSESCGCQVRCEKGQSFLDPGQVAQRWKTQQKIRGSNTMEWNLSQVLGLPHDDLHLLQCNLSPEASLREHEHDKK